MDNNSNDHATDAVDNNSNDHATDTADNNSNNQATDAVDKNSNDQATDAVDNNSNKQAIDAAKRPNIQKAMEPNLIFQMPKWQIIKFHDATMSQFASLWGRSIKIQNSNVKQFKCQIKLRNFFNYGGEKIDPKFLE